MSTWFKDPANGIDAQQELELVRQFDKSASAALWQHFTRACIDPEGMLAQNAMDDAPDVAKWQSRECVIVYRLIGNPPRPQLILAGHAVDLGGIDKLYSEGKRRARSK